MLIQNNGELTMVKLCDINQAAKEKLHPTFAEKSGIGVHYIDAFIKPMNTKLENGTRVERIFAFH